MLIELHGVVRINLSDDEFADKFVDFVESLGGCYFGLVKEVEDVEEDE